MRRIKFVFIVSLCAAFFFSSCSKVKGYGVLLWNLPENGLCDGDVVPVYIKSNITQQYVIGSSAGMVEIPLWQLSEPVGKHKAKKLSQEVYAECKSTYASVAADGLPMRAEPVNSAKQVYRLRKGEVIKILYKVNGQSPMTGGKPLEGSWYKVLTSDGTQGCCFSHNLRMFKTDEKGNRIGTETTEAVENKNADFDQLLLQMWYPDSYKSMIDSGRVEPAKINLSYNFHLDEDTKMLSFTMPEISEKWKYTGAESTGANAYKLNDIPIIVTVRRQNFIVVRYTGQSGKPEDFNFVTIDADINEVIENELARREKQYEQVYMFGPRFHSESYGTLALSDDHTFTWQNKNLLVPSVLTSSARNRGTVKTKYFISRTLSQVYDGVITFEFEGMKKEVNFLYKMEANGLRLEDATGALIDDSTLKERALSPLVIFFGRVESPSSNNDEKSNTEKVGTLEKVESDL